MFNFIIGHFVFPLISTFITCSIFYNLKLDKIKNRELLHIGIIFIVTATILSFVDMFLLMPGFVTVTIIYLLLRKKGVFFSVTITVCAAIIYSLSDAAAGLVLIGLFNKKVEELATSHLCMTFLFILNFLIALFTSYVLRSVLKGFLESLSLSNLSKRVRIRSVFVVVFLCFTFIVVIANLLVFKEFYTTKHLYLVLLNTFLTTAYVSIAITFMLIDGKFSKREMENEFKRRESQQLKEYTKSIESITRSMRVFKHDFNNILLTFDDFINAGDLYSLNQYYQKVLLEYEAVKENQNYSLLFLNNIKVLGVKGLVSSKLFRAQGLGYDVHIEIPEPLDIINIDMMDLCRMLGIFLDNAIESALELEEKKIGLIMVKRGQDSRIVITNTFDQGNPPIIGEIFKEGYSSKGENRGIGLYTIKKLIEDKYPNVLLNTKIKDGMFQQDIWIGG